MAQTTGGMSMVDGDIEVAVASSGTWVNLSGSANSIDTPTQTRMSGENYTLDGDTAVITYGKREPMDIKVNALYTEVTQEAFETVRPWFQAGTAIDLRWSPKGISAVGVYVFTALNVKITALDYPVVNASEASPGVISFTVRAPFVARTTAASSTGLGSA